MMNSRADGLDNPMVPENESERLDALRKYDILDSEPEVDYDNLAELASIITQTPVGLITFIDETRMWVKATTDPTVGTIPREQSFCQHALMKPNETLVIEDASTDERFRMNKLVNVENGIRFYAGTPLLDPSGLPLGVLCVIDRVPRTLSAQQLNALKSLARLTVSQLEVRRQSRELREANDAALSSAKSKTAFLANMSHEIRTPMNGILGIAALLKQTPLDESQRMLLRTMEQSGEGLMELLNDVLDYADHMVNRTTLVIESVNVHEVIGQVEDLMRPVTMRRNLRFQAVVSQAVKAPLETDPLRLRQILLQLLDNAVKFTVDGSIELQVKRVGDSLRFSVKDTGIGMATKLKELLAEPFNRVGETTDFQTAGRGLGLIAVRELLKLMDSTLNMESDPGIGSTFWFDLALATPPQSSVFPNRP